MSDLGENPQKEYPTVDDTKGERKEEKMAHKEKKDKGKKEFKKCNEGKCKSFGPHCEMDPKKMKKLYKMKQMYKMMQFMRFYYGLTNPYQMYYGIQPPPYFMHYACGMIPSPQGIYGPPKHCHKHHGFPMNIPEKEGIPPPPVFMKVPKHCHKRHAKIPPEFQPEPKEDYEFTRKVSGKEETLAHPPEFQYEPKHFHKYNGFEMVPPEMYGPPKHCYKHHGFGKGSSDFQPGMWCGMVPPGFQQGPPKHCHKHHGCGMIPPSKGKEFKY